MIYFLISQFTLAILFYFYYDKLLFKAIERKRQAKIEKRKIQFFNRIIVTEAQANNSLSTKKK